MNTPYPIFRSRINTSAENYQSNLQQMRGIVSHLETILQKSVWQGKEKYLVRHQKRGKLLARERIELLLDEDSPFLELMPLAGYEQKESSLGGSIIAGIGLVNGVECLLNASVPTIKGGALNAVSLQKGQRLDEIADQNQLPTIYLTESAGADLVQQAKIFNYGGSAFREITRRSQKGIPSMTIVFGSCTAGGAYIPGMSDYVIMVQKQAKVFLAGPPLVKMATNEEVDDESLGGATMHSTLSGVSDYLAKDENDAIRQAREIISHFELKRVPASPLTVEEPLYDREEILGIASADIKIPFNVKEVIARIVDGSRFSEFKPLYGNTLVTGFAKIHGMRVGIIGNNGVLFSESANKGAQFIQLCDQSQIPILFLQNITGFMVGQKYEEGGIIKNGAKLINTVANSTVPKITILIGASYGAGNYGMCGRAYQPRFLFAWPNSKIAVMGGQQLAGVLGMIREDAAKKSGKWHNPLTTALMKKKINAQIEEESNPYYGTSRIWDDGIIDPRETRTIVGFCLSIIHRIPIENRKEYGVFRM